MLSRVRGPKDLAPARGARPSLRLSLPVRRRPMRLTRRSRLPLLESKYRRNEPAPPRQLGGHIGRKSRGCGSRRRRIAPLEGSRSSEIRRPSGFRLSDWRSSRSNGRSASSSRTAFPIAFSKPSTTRADASPPEGTGSGATANASAPSDFEGGRRCNDRNRAKK